MKPMRFICLEKPAIDRLLDFLSTQESRKPAIDILIQEYLEQIGDPVPCQPSHISPLMEICMFFYFQKIKSDVYDFFCLAIENVHETTTMCSTQQSQTIQYYQSAVSFYPTPLTSGNDVMYDPNYDYRNTASTPLLP